MERIVRYETDLSQRKMYVSWKGERLDCQFEPTSFYLYSYMQRVAELKRIDIDLALWHIEMCQKFFSRRGKQTALKLKHIEDIIDW